MVAQHTDNRRLQLAGLGGGCGGGDGGSSREQSLVGMEDVVGEGTSLRMFCGCAGST